MNDDRKDMPNGFRDTPLGPLPEDWQVVRLGEVIALIRNGLTKRQAKDGHGIPVSRIETIADGTIDFSRVGYVSDLSQSEIDKYALRDGDILFSHINSEPMLGKTAVYRKYMPTLIHGMNLLLIRSRQNLYLSEFANYQFQFLRSKGVFMGLAARAVGQASINQGKLKSLEIPLPPLSEQCAIAQVLSTIQRAIEATERVIAAARELKKSLMRHLFTYGPVPPSEAESVPLRETEIGPLPVHWQVVRLGDVAEVRAGVAFPYKYQGATAGKYPFYKVADMNTPGNEKYMQHSHNWIDDDLLIKLKANLFPKLTVVFPKVGGALLTNKKRLLSQDSLVDNNIMGVMLQKGKNEFIPEYCFYWFESIDIRKFSNPGPLPSINAQAIKQAPIPLPPLPEQQRIAEILQVVDAKIQAEENRKAALQSLFKSMLHRLMTGKVQLSWEFITRFKEDR